MMMALQEGAQLNPHGVCILWVRSLDYILATPLLLLDLGLLAGAQADELVLIIISDMLMIATGYYASMAVTYTAKWCLFFFSMLTFVPILYTLIVSLQSHKELTEHPKGACAAEKKSGPPCAFASPHSPPSPSLFCTTTTCSAPAVQLPRGVDSGALELLLGGVAAL